MQGGTVLGACRSSVTSRCWWCRRATTAVGWSTVAMARGRVLAAAAAARRARRCRWKRRLRSLRSSPTWNSARRQMCVVSRTKWRSAATLFTTPSSHPSSRSRVTDAAATPAAHSRTHSATCHKIWFPFERLLDAHSSARISVRSEFYRRKNSWNVLFERKCCFLIFILGLQWILKIIYCATSSQEKNNIHSWRTASEHTHIMLCSAIKVIKWCDKIN